MAGSRPFLQVICLGLRCYNLNCSRLYRTKVYPTTIEMIAYILRSKLEMPDFLEGISAMQQKQKTYPLYPFLPNKYEMQFDLPSARCACTTSLKTSSSITQQKYL